ncbi:hypothetical protein FOZ63_015132, partial [Perkinsus olseni]
SRSTSTTCHMTLSSTLSNYFQPLRFPTHSPISTPADDATIACRFADNTDEEYPVATITFKLSGVVLNFNNHERHLSPIGIVATPATYARVSGSGRQKAVVYHASPFPRCMLSFASATDCDLVVNYLTSCAVRVTASVMATTGLNYNDVQPEDDASRVLLSGSVIQYSPNQPPRYGPDGSTGRKFVLGYADVT